MVANATDVTRSPADDLEMLQHPDRWPHHPFLPMRHNPTWDPITMPWESLGLLVVIDGVVKPIVLQTSIFMVPYGLADAPQHVFESFEKMREAGWVVD